MTMRIAKDNFRKGFGRNLHSIGHKTIWSLRTFILNQKLKKLTKFFKGFDLIIQDAISAIRDFGIVCGHLKKYIKEGELDG